MLRQQLRCPARTTSSSGFSVVTTAQYSGNAQIAGRNDASAAVEQRSPGRRGQRIMPARVRSTWNCSTDNTAMATNSTTATAAP